MTALMKIWCCVERFFAFLCPVGDLFIRIWVGQIFFFSGWVKLQNWDSTRAIFEYEYAVPFLPHHVAAHIATIAELVLPVLLVLGLLGRLPAFLLFVFNTIAVVSYPFLFTEDGAVGFDNHIYWGLLLLVLLLHGNGKLSLDTWLFKKHCPASRH